MVLDGSLAATGDEQDLLDACGNGLFHDILHQRLVDQRQHLLGRRLGGRQETCPHTGNRKNGFFNFHNSTSWVHLNSATIAGTTSSRPMAIR